MSDVHDGNTKKVVIKIHENGAIEVISKDPDIAVVLILPDGSEAKVLEGEVRAYGQRDEDDLPPPVQKRIDP